MKFRVILSNRNYQISVNCIDNSILLNENIISLMNNLNTACDEIKELDDEVSNIYSDNNSIDSVYKEHSSKSNDEQSVEATNGGIKEEQLIDIKIIAIWWFMIDFMARKNNLF